MTVFITGDRSMSAFYPPLVAIEMLRALGAGRTIVTGDNDGVEAIVRELAEQAGVEVGVVGGYAKDWDARHAYLRDEYDFTEVIAVHSAPEASSVVRSLFTVFTDDDAVRLVTAMDLLV